MRRLHGLYRAIGLAGQVKSDRHMLCVPEEGKNAYRVKKIVPVKELIASLKREYAMAAT